MDKSISFKGLLCLNMPVVMIIVIVLALPFSNEIWNVYFLLIFVL